jgi:hypothetical protein
VGKRLAAMLVVALFVLGEAACGGSGDSGGSTSKADYIQQMQSLGKELSTSFDNLSKTKPTDIPSSIAVLSKIGAALDTAGDKLDAIDPPSEVADSHQKLVDGAHESADDFRGVADELQQAKPSEVPQLLKQLNPSTLPGFQKMQEAVSELKAKGYDLGQLSS